MKFNKKFSLILLIMFLGILLAGSIIFFVQSRFKAAVTTVNTQNAKIAYYIRGKGDPIVLLPGFGMTMSGWDPLFLEKLAANHELIILDYRGVGASTGFVNNVTEAQLADDVHAVLQQLKLKKATLLGWSMGSFVAQVVAEKYPSSVDKLILISTGPGDKQEIGASAAISDAIENNLGGSWETTYVPYLFASEQGKNDYLQRLHLALQSKEIPNVPAESLEAKVGYEKMFADADAENMRYTKLSSLHMQTLIVGGEQDKLLPPENDKRTAAQIPGSTIIIFSQAGHAVLFEKVDEVTSLINTFLRRK
ncbi:MAG: alpha/beta fold hydrolase [Candidatus Levyibacteriota bacterium]